MSQKFPFSIGVGMFIRNGNTILVGRRGKGCSRGVGCLALPGGHVEPGETIIQAALREVKEETGLDVEHIGGTAPPGSSRPELYTNAPFCIPGLLAVTDHFDLNQQVDGKLLEHLSFWMMTRYIEGVPVNMEPTKCERWEWMRPADIAKLDGVENPTHPQYYWTPIPLWRRILRPYFGEI